MLDFEEEALDEVAFTVEGEIASNLRGCFSWRNDRYGVLAFDSVAEILGIVAFIAKDIVCGKIGDQSLGLSDVADLTGCENEPKRVAQGIDDCVDFGGQPTPRAADRTSFRPPFLPAAC